MSSDNKDVVISSIVEFKHNIKPCREIKIPRSYAQHTIRYTHHVVVTRADVNMCEMIHYSSTSPSDFLKCNSPSAISRIKLIYDEYEKSDDVKKIFDFNKGDKVIIVQRTDYPNTQEEIDHVITRAESRLGEKLYSAHNNNCESYVNWVFTGENESKQIQNAGLLEKALAHAIDINLTNGAENLYVSVGIPVLMAIIDKKHSNEGINGEPDTKIIAANGVKETIVHIEVSNATEQKSTLVSPNNGSITPDTTGRNVSNSINERSDNTTVPQNTSSQTDNTAVKGPTKEKGVLKKTNMKQTTTEHVHQKETKQKSSNVDTCNHIEHGESTQNLADDNAITSKKIAQSVSQTEVQQKTTEFLTRHAESLKMTHTHEGQWGLVKEVLDLMPSVTGKLTSDLLKSLTAVTDCIGGYIKMSQNIFEQSMKWINKAISLTVNVVEQIISCILSIARHLIGCLKSAYIDAETFIFTISMIILEIVEAIRKSPITIAATAELVYLVKRVYSIWMEPKKEKLHSIIKEVIMTLCAIKADKLGYILGQTYIPVPYIGGLLGGLLFRVSFELIGKPIVAAAYDATICIGKVLNNTLVDITKRIQSWIQRV